MPSLFVTAAVVEGCASQNGQDTGNGSQNPKPADYRLSPVADVPDIRGQLDAVIEGTYEGQKGCWAVASVPGDYLNPAEASRYFVTPDGQVGGPMELPLADERSYGPGASYTDDNGDTVTIIPFSSTAGFPEGASGAQHGFLVCNDLGSCSDYNLFEEEDVTRPAGVIRQGGEAVVLFNNGDITTSDGTRFGSVDGFLPPSLVTIGNAAEDLDLALEDLDATAENVNAILSDSAGGFYLVANGGSVNLEGPQAEDGAFINVTSDRAVSEESIKAGLAAGPAALDLSGRVYVSGWRPDGDMIASIDSAGNVTYHNLNDIAGLGGLSFPQGLLPLTDAVYVRISEGGKTRTFYFNPDVENPSAIEYGDPIPADWTHNFRVYDTLEDGTLLACTGDSGTGDVGETGEDGIPRTVKTSTVGFHEVVPE